MTKLYENIKMLCKERNISVLELERQTGFKPTSIHKWGKKEPICASVLKVALYFNVSFDFLLGLTTNRYSNEIIFSFPIQQIIDCCEKNSVDERTADVVVKMIEAMK